MGGQTRSGWAGGAHKYESLDPDWADVSLVWLGEHLGTRHIATIDVTDFSVYRLHGRTRFELELLG